MVTGDDGGVVTGAGGGVVTGAGGGVVTGAGGGLVTGAGGGLVTGAGGGLVTGSGGGVLCSAGGGGFVADSPGSGAVVAGGTAAVGVGNGDGWGASVAPPGDGPGSAGVVPTGAGVPPALSPVRAAWDWLALACAGVMPGGSGGMTRSGRPGPPTSPPVAAGTVMVTAAPGRAWTVPVGSLCHSHSATPVVATATDAIGASSHGDSSHPNQSRWGCQTRGWPRRGCRTRGRPRRGGPDVVVNQSPNASDWPAATRRTRDRAGSRAPRAGAARVAVEPPPCAPCRGAIVVAFGARGAQDGDGNPQADDPLVCGSHPCSHAADARESPVKDCPQISLEAGFPYP